MDHIHSQHKISELIAFLQEQMNKHGDLPIVYWDQHSNVTFNDISNIAKVNDSILYFGGFHVNGDLFCGKNDFIRDEDDFVPAGGCDHDN